MKDVTERTAKFEFRGIECIAKVTYTDYRKSDWDPRQMKFLQFRKEQEKKSRLYYGEDGVMDKAYGDHPPYSVKGDDLANDKAWRKYNKMESDLARAAIDAVFPEFGKSLFSRKAGCSCPCSPGFISKSLVGGQGWIRVTLVE
jgi:hypothetical protein